MSKIICLKADISTLNTIVAHAQEARSSALQDVVSACQEFCPLRREVNQLRKIYLSIF
jgi:hypothetical protein